MKEADRSNAPDDCVLEKRKILIVGSIALIGVAGAAVVSSTVRAFACSAPPCPAPGPVSPP